MKFSSETIQGKLSLTLNRVVARASGLFESKRTGETPVPLQPRRFRGSKRKSFIGRNLTLALLVLGGWTPALAQDARFFRIVGPVVTTITEVTADGTVTWTNVATNATFTVQTTTALPDATNWVDWVQVPLRQPAGMAGPLAEANGYRFSSKEWHANAGLYYYGFRYYEPNLQRWLNRDPIGEAGGINLYEFCFTDPLNVNDAYGLWGIQFGDFNIGIGNPTLAFSNETWNDIEEGSMAGADGFIPFYDPFADAGYYDPCDKDRRQSHVAGGIAREARVAAGTGGVGLARGGTARILAGGRNATGICQFPTSLGTYVGQSGNIGGRLVQHGQRVAGPVKRWKVGGGQLQREIAEQARIDKLGGIKKLANRKNQIGVNRQHLNQPRISAETAAGLGGAVSASTRLGDNNGCP